MLKEISRRPSRPANKLYATGGYWGQLMMLGVFLLPALALVLPSGYSYGPVVMLLGALTMALASLRQQPAVFPLPVPTKAVMAVMILYALFWMGDVALRDEGLRELDRPSRFLLASLCLPALARARINHAWFWIGLALGSIGAGGIAVWQKSVEHMARASGFAQTIQFGNAAILMGLMCLAGLLWAWQIRGPHWQRRLLSGLLFLGALGGITASFLSGTRGAWLALVPAAFVGAWTAWRLKHVRAYLLIGPVLLATIVFAAYLHPASPVEYRVISAVEEIEHYFEGNGGDRGAGVRFEMWRGALQAFTERPLFGWGERGYIERTAAMGKAGFITESAARHTHAHNEWLNVLAKKGTAGGMIFLGLYMVPLLAFIRAGHIARKGTAVDIPQLAMATAGALFVLGFMATGMTQVNFNHNIGVMLYAFMTAVLAGLCFQERSR